MLILPLHKVQRNDGTQGPQVELCQLEVATVPLNPLLEVP